MDYESLFDLKQHKITIRYRDKGYGVQKAIAKNKHIEKLISLQKPNTDLYISKYPSSRLIQTIILDFDSEDKERAYADAVALQEYTNKYGLNTVIVSSGQKGYHTYTQTPPHLFTDGELLNIPSDGYGLRFCYYVKGLIGYSPEKYPTLDMINFSAGLEGNIRVIGSKHPVTGCDCEIVKGRFTEPVTVPNEHDYLAYKYAFFKADKVEKSEEREVKPQSSSIRSNPIKDNDLRSLMPQIYGGKVKRYGNYVMMQCPFHNDNNPSLVVTKEYYYCKGCGEKGNWWTLKSKGVVDFDYKECDNKDILEMIE